MHRFLIYSEQNHTIQSFFENKILLNGFIIEYENNLDIKIISDEIILIGAVVYQEESITNLTKINSKDANLLEEIYECIKAWSGRWVLLYNDLIIGDPLNSLNIFYSKKDDNYILSNSLGVFQTLKYNRNENVYNPTSKDEINWNIAPKTRLQNVWLLLPFQIIDLNNGIINFQRFIRENQDNNVNLKDINNSVLNVLNLYSASNKQIYLTLTAGYDSRYLLAVMLKSVRKFKNLLFIDDRIKKADIIISSKISLTYGIEQLQIRKKSLKILLKRIFCSKRKKLVDNFDCNNCQEIDRRWYINGMYDLNTDCYLFRGNIGTEVFQGHKNYLYYPKGDGSIDSAISSLQKKYPKLNNEQMIDLEYWWNFREDFIKDSGIDWRLLFWLDQRCCAWAGSINSIFDLTNLSSINPLNSDVILENLYNYTNKGDIENGYQRELINSLIPELNEYPYNPKLKKFDLIKLSQ